MGRVAPPLLLQFRLIVFPNHPECLPVVSYLEALRVLSVSENESRSPTDAHTPYRFEAKLSKQIDLELRTTFVYELRVSSAVWVKKPYHAPRLTFEHVREPLDRDITITLSMCVPS